MGRIKRVACINDICGFGRCSLTTAIPILSVIGVQPCPVPTAILSKHTGFESFTFSDFTPQLPEYLSDLASVDFDGIYSGFLGSAEQIMIVEDMLRGHSGSIKLVDPVMGDNGKVYATYTKRMCAEMRRLTAAADIITPNITEACILTSSEYAGEDITADTASGLAEQLSHGGQTAVVITGITDGRMMTNLTYEKGCVTTASFERTDCVYSGTGDIFASVLCGYVMQGCTVAEAAARAGEFVSLATRLTLEGGSETADGVEFERCLHTLYRHRKTNDTSNLSKELP